MATKEEFVDEVSKLPGVSKKAAEALYDAGYKSMDDLKGLSKEKLQEVKGIGPKTADAILAGIAAPTEAEGEADKVEVVEKAAAKKTKGKAAKEEKRKARGEEPAAEVVEPEAVHKPKIKAEISPELPHALTVR